MTVKITSVYDEGALENTPLIGAKGFSVLVERDGKRVLVDTGLRDRYLEHNLDHLEVDPDSIDAVVITQADPCNCRALPGLLRNRTKPVRVIAPAGVYAGRRGFLSRAPGLPDDMRDMAEVEDIEGWTEVVPGVHVSPQLATSEGTMESYVVVEGQSLIVIGGAGHGGVAEALAGVSDHFGKPARTYIGSLVLEKRKGVKDLAARYASEMDAAGIREFYLNHSTGQDGMTFMRVALGLSLVKDFYVGTVYKE